MIKRFLQILISITVIAPGKSVVEFTNWAFHFPAGSNMGLFIALAVPIEVPNENVFVAYNFEANYLLPANQSETVQFPPLVTEEEARYINKINRTSVYRAMETKMQTYGYKGHLCLLKTICEVTATSLEHNGLLGDILHIILTPSSSNDTDLSPAYLEAEQLGKTSGDCSQFKKKCPTNFLNFITRLKL